jgi:hypothetical protein
VKRLGFCSGALALLLAACGGNPQQLPIGISACHASLGRSGLEILATVENKGDRPMSRLDMTVTFYQDFRYRTFTGTAQLPQELDPGQQREVAFQTPAVRGGTPRGQAQRCFVTRIGYLDGTSQSVRQPPF